MIYTPVRMNLTSTQGRKLLKFPGQAGGSLKLKHSAHTGGAIEGKQEAVAVHLTAKQVKELIAAQGAGKPFILTFTLRQAEHHVRRGDDVMGQKGTGFWSRLWRGIKKVGKAVYKGAIKPIAKTLYNNVPLVKEAVDSTVSNAAALAGVAANSIIPGSGDSVTKAVNRVGNKIVDDVTSRRSVAPAVKPLPNFLQPAAVQWPATPAASAPAGSGVKRRGQRGGRLVAMDAM